LVHEVKFDGFRLLGFLADGEARLVTRNRKDWTDRFPSIVDAMKALRARSVVIDMEAAVTINGKTSFQELQNMPSVEGALPLRSSDTCSTSFTSTVMTSELFLCFDRKRRLQPLLQAATKRKVLIYSDHFTGDGAESLRTKRADSARGHHLQTGEVDLLSGRQKSWLKRSARCGRSSSSLASASLAAALAPSALCIWATPSRGSYAMQAKSGTGFTMKSAHELSKRFGSMPASTTTLTRSEMEGISSGEYRAISWIKPTLLCEVEVHRMTNDGRISASIFQGLREDKNAADVKQDGTYANSTRNSLQPPRSAG
jgi:bifunctional non-homologous end joining protein LigD